MFVDLSFVLYANFRMISLGYGVDHLLDTSSP
jgi:hypothetical protein